MKKKALHSVLSAIFLLHLLLLTAAAASPTPSSLNNGNNNAVAVAPARTRSSRRVLLQQQPRAAAPAAMATNTFRVNGVHQAAANGEPKVEFDASMRPKPGTNFNPRHN
ncbi:hypothetical protein E2562_021115 [Oryza meyeriana var. granulata]|uniref:Uncharacterized protein n=1 Tax=Oryza meyeriana var. granulata TaxID=110450 RepID=A0A6G1BM66_9ORYZ|nr:hypothetical protein E2562_021115 [Oryza meyeriana var. granulata]